MSDIWIDLTDMVVWRGHFTGIQRVVYSYASRFNRDNARFFIYDPIDKRHVEVLFSILDRSEDPAPPVELTKRQKVKKVIGKPYYILPPSAKRRLGPAVKVLNNVSRTTLHKVLDKKQPESQFFDYPTADFSNGDTVILLGAGWNEPSSLEYLCRVKETTPIKIVQHINDILPIYQPHLFADELPRLFTPYVQMAVKHADTITVISEATKRDIVTFCKQQKIQAPKIVVVRLGEDGPLTPPVKPPHFFLKGDFVLCVGTFEIRKNYILLYQAAKLAELESREFPNIVIAGRKGWLTEDLAHVVERDPYAQGKICWLSDVSDAGVEWLQENCLFSVFPSLCEGWGLPVVESLRHGKLCLTSNVSSMLEIGVGMVDYFSPYDARSCMDKIIHYADADNAVQANKKVKESYKSFTWDDSYHAFKKAIAVV